MPGDVKQRAIGWLAGIIHLGFFARYALFVPFLLVLLTLLGWQYRTNTILGNVFLVDSPLQLLQLTWLSLVAVALSMVEARVTLLNAKDRFPDCPDWRFDGPNFTAGWFVVWTGLWLLAGLCLPLVCAWATPYGNTGQPPALGDIAREYGASIAIGVGAAAALLVIASGLARFAIGHNLTAAELLPSDALFRRFAGTRIVAAIDGLVARLLRASPGYVEAVERDVETDEPLAHRLRPGHAQLFLTLVLALAGYAIVYFTVPPGLATLPVLFYVLLVLIIFGVMLSAAAFWLDRYRLPVPIVLLGVVIGLSLVSQNDHFFAMLPWQPTAAESSPPTLYDIVRQWQPADAPVDDPRALPRGKDGKRTLVVVAAAGGGIQAAAWTAKVLTELHARYGLAFTGSVRLVSGVSGGSVGLMYYLDRYAQLRAARTREETAATLEAINEQARASSLEASAWGVAFYDLAPTFLPVRRLWPGLLRDRGTVLEDLWSSRLAHRDATKFTLRGLQADIRERGFPIPVFNSTNGSTGARFLWSPIRLIERDTGRVCDPEELAEVYPNWDLSVVSAARLSATFSYVSPICRPVFGDDPYPRVPFADGGYAENEGILTVIQALTQLLSHYQADEADAEPPPFDRILIVRILPFAGSQPLPRARYDGLDADLEEHVAASAWRRALTGPLELLSQVRETSQSERGEWEAAQMQAVLVSEARRWAATAGADEEPAAPSGRNPLRRWLEPFAVTHNLVRRQKTGEATPLGRAPDSQAAPSPPREPHPLRPADEAPPAVDQPPLQIAAIKFAFTLPGHAGVSHTAQLVVQPTDDSWSDYFTPLSWKMNRRQSEALDVAWQRIAQSDLGLLSPLDEPLYFAPGDAEPSQTLDDLFERVGP